MILGVADFISTAKRRGHEIFESQKRPYNLNIVGWRNREAAPNTFDDWLGVYYKDDGIWVHRKWPITTRPGKPWLVNPMNKKGAAILVPGQYRNAYTLGTFKGYPALLQAAPLPVFRDANLDVAVDVDQATIEVGMFGIHIHQGGVIMKFIGRSSAGCQVFQRSNDFFEFMSFVKLSKQYWGNSFTYTLMEF